MTRVLAILVLFAAMPSQALTDRSGPYEVQVLIGGAPARTFSREGEAFVLGRLGERYVLRIVNRTGQRAEAVISVDGRDVIDGKPADWRQKEGYLVPAFGSVEIEGWRLSQQEVAAFRFSSVADSYAARTGHAREVGVIGVAIFAERPQQPRHPLSVQPPAPWEGPRSDVQGEDGVKPAPQARKSERPGLGTGFGEAVPSGVTEVPFERAHERPDAVLGVRYDDRAGLIAMGIEVDGAGTFEAGLRRTAQPFPVVERGYAEPPPGWRR